MTSTDPVTLLLDDDGDIDVGGGRAKLASGLEGAALCADARIETIRGELFWARAVGFPLLPNAFVAESDAVFGDSFDERRLQSVFREALLTTPNAVEMRDFRPNLDRKTRIARPRYRLRVVFDDLADTIGGEQVLRG